MASEKYDLTPLMSPYFDVHLVGPLLDHLSEVTFLHSARYLLNNSHLPFTSLNVPHSFSTHMNQMNIYSKKVLTTEKIKIVEPTNMIELIEDEYEKFPEDADFQTEYTARKALFEERKEKIFNMLDNTPVRRNTFFYVYFCAALLNIE